MNDSTASHPLHCNACGGTGYINDTPSSVPPIGNVQIDLTQNQVNEALEHLQTRADEEARAIEDWKKNNTVPNKGDIVQVVLNGVVVDVLDSPSCLMFTVYLDHSGKVVEVIISDNDENITLKKGDGDDVA
ncbi:MAG: hypothetical protein PHQ43_14810 [Dehalococcoidales bacterium]|nr:hypothetical protein [Dehalococcoidales bacterium]